MHDAEELCDRVAFIVGGTVKAVDTPHALRKSNADTQVEYSYLSNGKSSKMSALCPSWPTQRIFKLHWKRGILTSIHSKEQTLEDVFISLTGRGLQ